MEHIIQIAIGVDDESIKRNVAEHAEKVIIEHIEKDIRDLIFEKNGYDRITGPKYFVKKLVEDIIEDNKPEIIKAAAENLADRLMKSKKVREAVDEVLSSVKGDE